MLLLESASRCWTPASNIPATKSTTCSDKYTQYFVSCIHTVHTQRSSKLFERGTYGQKQHAVAGGFCLDQTRFIRDNQSETVTSKGAFVMYCCNKLTICFTLEQGFEANNHLNILIM
ncbi:hypothetical protein GOODEAATRI_003102 [Goodea atripinnis]|uniref:Uncharacterized protein n=1 Tax=Goodea atripinnis TaxID=208336 RepID=A0ABV0NH23_9TELE